MSRRSHVFRLPPKLRAELDRRLIASGFGNYVGLSKWLARKGHSIGKSSLGRYGQATERKLIAAGIPVESIIGGDVRASEAHIQIIIVEPSTRKTWTYSTPTAAAVVREQIERAISSPRKAGTNKKNSARRRSQKPARKRASASNG